MGLGQKILDEFNSTLPMRVISAEVYFGTFVRFNLADVTFHPLTLRAYMTDWKLVDGSEILTTSYGTREEWAEIGCLAGDLLSEIEYVNGDCLVLLFASGKSFILNSNLVDYAPEDEMLTIYAPDKFGLGYSPKRGFRINAPDE